MVGTMTAKRRTCWYPSESDRRKRGSAHQVSIRLPADVKARLESLAKSQGVSRSAMVSLLVQKAV